MKFRFFSFLLLFVFSFGAALAQETGVKGKVRASNEKVLGGVEITARQDGKDIKSVKSDNNGGFTLAGLKPGKYNFVFTKSGFTTGLKADVEVAENKIRDLGDRLIMMIDQGTLVFIKGSVFNEGGRSIYGAEVKVERISSDGKVKKVGSGFTGDSGEFAFRFPDGAAKYRVTASSKGKTASEEVEVLNAAVYRVALTLDFSKDKDQK